MKDSGGKWIEEPPPHEPIIAEGNDWEVSIGNWTCLAFTLTDHYVIYHICYISHNKEKYMKCRKHLSKLTVKISEKKCSMPHFVINSESKKKKKLEIFYQTKHILAG